MVVHSLPKKLLVIHFIWNLNVTKVSNIQLGVWDNHLHLLGARPNTSQYINDVQIIPFDW